MVDWCRRVLAYYVRAVSVELINMPMPCVAVQARGARRKSITLRVSLGDDRHTKPRRPPSRNVPFLLWHITRYVGRPFFVSGCTVVVYHSAIPIPSVAPLARQFLGASTRCVNHHT